MLINNGADSLVCNGLAMAVSALKSPKAPTCVQAGAGVHPILGYGDMISQAHVGNGETYKIILTQRCIYTRISYVSDIL